MKNLGAAKRVRLLALLGLGIACACAGAPAPSSRGAASLAIGDTFLLESSVLEEMRRVNVYRPPGGAEPDAPLPVLVLLDGGIGEDFLHVAGLVQVSVGNGTMRPFLLVGVENTERRRDLTGPTENEEDRRIAPRVGGSEAFRSFLRSELMPEIRRRYATTEEAAIVGESLAGLFVVETFLLEPELFDTYVAIDPSLWWNDRRLLERAAGLVGLRLEMQKTLYLATSDLAEIADASTRLAEILRRSAVPGFRLHHVPMPGETHRTIFHPAALVAFRTVFAPRGE